MIDSSADRSRIQQSRQGSNKRVTAHVRTDTPQLGSAPE
ncbi:hypothetical protein T261_1549 [Streptomyces lydicus]|nr:hypothetical protein T261_1549 [Streptomyces lydicus]